MKRTAAMAWALQVLDDGLRLYRRHLLGFVLVGATVMIPVAILSLLFVTLLRTQFGGDWVIAGNVLLFFLQYPVWLYVCAALSRAAVMALDGGPIKLGRALRIGPVRAMGIGCYNLLFTIIVFVFFSVTITSVTCPLVYVAIFGSTFLTALGGVGASPALGGMFGSIFLLSWLSLILLFTGTLASSAYAVQAFAVEHKPFGSSVSRSVDLLTFRLGRNLLVFFGAGAIIGTLLIAWTGAIIAGGTGLVQLLGLELAPAVTDTLVTIVSAASLVVLLPPLPIWMSLVHRALAKERDGGELETEVEQWATRLNVEPQQS